jgi:hypothetical protein
MKKFRLALAFLALSLITAPSFASTIDFGQWGANGTELSNLTYGYTSDGIRFSVFGPGDGFTVLTEGSTWQGQFSYGTPLLFTNSASGAVVLRFDEALTSITGLSVQANAHGLYTATALIYDGGLLLDTLTYTDNNTLTGEGTIPSFNFASEDGFTTIVLSASNDHIGIGVGSSVPVPAALPLFGTALVSLIGVKARKRKA